VRALFNHLEMERATNVLVVGAGLALIGAHWSTGIGKALLIAPAAFIAAACASQVGVLGSNWAIKNDESDKPSIKGLLPIALAFVATYGTVEYCAMRWL
jgi:hypothetical protein